MSSLTSCEKTQSVSSVKVQNTPPIQRSYVKTYTPRESLVKKADSKIVFRDTKKGYTLFSNSVVENKMVKGPRIEPMTDKNILGFRLTDDPPVSGVNPHVNLHIAEQLLNESDCVMLAEKEGQAKIQVTISYYVEPKAGGYHYVGTSINHENFASQRHEEMITSTQEMERSFFFDSRLDPLRCKQQGLKVTSEILGRGVGISSITYTLIPLSDAASR